MRNTLGRKLLRLIVQDRRCNYSLTNLVMDQQTALKKITQLIESAYFTLAKEWTINPSHFDMFRSIFGHYARLLLGQDSSYSIETEDDSDCFTFRYEQRNAMGRLSELIYINYDYNYDDAQSVRVHHRRWDGGSVSLEIWWDLNFDRDNRNKLYYIGLQRGELVNMNLVWAYKYNKPFNF